MPTITISIDEDVKKILDKRAKKNLLSLREQIEDILRQSAIRTKSGTVSSEKMDDKLVGIFSREIRGNRRK
jgi:Txe/YoeB family toxin of Txe-Axe toxin-antitoxin module